MESINLAYFFRMLNAFNLNGCVTPGSGEQGTLCEITVGDGRVVHAEVMPEHVTYDLWNRDKDGNVVCELNQPVQLKGNSAGFLEFDAEAIVREKVKDAYQCSTFNYDTWREYGIDTICPCITEFGIGLYNFNVIPYSVDTSKTSIIRFAPGILTINGAEIEWIGWRTDTDKCGLVGEQIFPVIKELLSGKHELSSSKIMSFIEQQNIPLRYIEIDIETVNGYYWVWSNNDEDLLFIELPNEINRIYMLDKKDQKETLSALLNIVPADTDEKVKKRILKMMMLGILSEA